MATEHKLQGPQASPEDPWQSGEGDPWQKTLEDQDAGKIPVSDSPVSDGGAKKAPAQTEDSTEKKDDQEVTGGAAAGSSGDVKIEETKTEDAKKETDTTDKDKEVDSQSIHTPKPRPKTLRPTPREGSWWSASPLRQWYDEDRSSGGNWWTSAWNPYPSNYWNWTRGSQWS